MKLFGENFDVFALNSVPENPESFLDVRDDRAYTVFLLPSLNEDARIYSISHGAERRSYLAPSIASAVFLVSFRGLPLEVVSVETPKGIMKIKISGNSGKYSVELPKCKVLCSKTTKYDGGIEILRKDIDVLGEKIRVTRTHDSCLCGAVVLKRLLVSDGDAASACAAYSVLNAKTYFKCCSPRRYEEALFTKSAEAIFASERDFSKMDFVIEGEEFSLSRTTDCICLSAQMPRAMVFNAYM